MKRNHPEDLTQSIRCAIIISTSIAFTKSFRCVFICFDYEIYDVFQTLYILWVLSFLLTGINYNIIIQSSQSFYY